MFFLKRYGLLLTLLFTLVACSTLTGRPDAPIVSLADIKFSKMGLLEQSFTLTLRMKNPNDFRLPLRGLNYALKLNGSKLAEGASASKVTIPAYGEALIEVDLVSNLLTAFNQLKGLSGTKPLKYSLSGKVGVVNKAFKLPFSKEGEISFVEPIHK
jgi:LEA14-like dessication related protein